MRSIEYREGDLFEQTDLDALAHGCNTQGLMGAGIARTFRAEYPEMFQQYVVQCGAKRAKPGGLFLWKDPWASTKLRGAPKYVFNLFTQEKPGRNAKLEYLYPAFSDMYQAASWLGVKSIGLPEIGCGIGGLEWDDVEGILSNYDTLFPTIKTVVVRYKP